MIHVDLICVGQLKERHWRDAAAEYLKRLGPYAKVAVREVPDRDLAFGQDQALLAEGSDILRLMPASAYVAALDSAGVARTSEGLASWMDAQALAGRSRIAFVIGGSAGLHPDVIARADERMSLGPMTLPHQLARVVLLEQLYRAFKISRHEPYHR